MKRRESLISEIKYSLPDRQLLQVVNFGAVKVNDELVVLKNRYDHIPTCTIEYDAPYCAEHNYQDIYGKSVIFSPDTFSRRGLKAMVELAELMDNEKITTNTKHAYKHLDQQPQFNIGVNFTMEELAKQVCRANYGLHRFISEVIDIKRNSEYPQDKEFADGLEKLLNERYKL